MEVNCWVSLGRQKGVVVLRTVIGADGETLTKGAVKIPKELRHRVLGHNDKDVPTPEQRLLMR